MIRRIGIAIALVSLFGCISAEQRARIDAERAWREQQEQQARQQAYVLRLAQQCQALGFQPDTDPMRQCMLQLHSNNSASRDALINSLLLNQVQQQQQQQYRAMPLCSSLPADMAGYQRAQGTCR